MNGASVNKLDATGLEMTGTLLSYIDHLRVQLYFTRLQEMVFMVLKRGGFYDRIRHDHFLKSTDEAFSAIVNQLEQHEHEGLLWTHP